MLPIFKIVNFAIGLYANGFFYANIINVSPKFVDVYEFGISLATFIIRFAEVCSIPIFSSHSINSFSCPNLHKSTTKYYLPCQNLTESFPSSPLGTPITPNTQQNPPFSTFFINCLCLTLVKPCYF